MSKLGPSTTSQTGVPHTVPSAFGRNEGFKNVLRRGNGKRTFQRSHRRMRRCDCVKDGKLPFCTMQFRPLGRTRLESSVRGVSSRSARILDISSLFPPLCHLDQSRQRHSSRQGVACDAWLATDAVSTSLKISLPCPFNRNMLWLWPSRPLASPLVQHPTETILLPTCRASKWRAHRRLCP